MSAYLIIDTDVHNPEAYEDYKAQVSPIIDRFGGTYLSRGGEITSVQTELWFPTRMVIVEFPSRAQAEAFLDSPDYAPIKAIRLASAHCNVILVDGL